MFRGLAIAGMILVNSPGDWGIVYPQLGHAEWHGWTLADMVFPAFLFAVGMAIGLSFPKDLSAPGARTKLWLRVARRTATLILVGLLLHAFYVTEFLGLRVGVGEPGLGHLRIPGVLQRIGLCYGAAVALILLLPAKSEDGKTDINPRVIVAAIAAALILYWLLLSFVPVPGFGVGRLDPEGNLGAYIDRGIFTPAHLWAMGSVSWGGPIVYDPEGLLSTLPAWANTLFGVLAGRAWKRSGEAAAPRLALLGALLLVAALLLDPLFPINKRIWTSSFAVLSSGFAILTLVALGFALRSRLVERAARPLKILGGNALLAYVISEVMAKLSEGPWFRWDGQAIGAQTWVYRIASSLIPDPYLASLACAFAVLVFVTLILWPLHRRAIHLRL